MKDKIIKVSIDRIIEIIKDVIDKDDKYRSEIKNINTISGRTDDSSVLGYYRCISFEIPNSTLKKLNIVYSCIDKETINLNITSIFETSSSNSINDVFNKDLKSEFDVYSSIIDIERILGDSLKQEVEKISPIEIMMMVNMSYFCGYKYHGITDNIIKTVESISDQYQINSSGRIIDKINSMNNELIKKLFSTEHIVISIGKSNLIFYAPRKTIVNIRYTNKFNEETHTADMNCTVEALVLQDPLSNEDIINDPISVLLKNSIEH